MELGRGRTRRESGGCLRSRPLLRRAWPPAPLVGRDVRLRGQGTQDPEGRSARRPRPRRPVVEGYLAPDPGLRTFGCVISVGRMKQRKPGGWCGLSTSVCPGCRRQTHLTGFSHPPGSARRRGTRVSLVSLGDLVHSRAGRPTRLPGSPCSLRYGKEAKDGWPNPVTIKTSRTVSSPRSRRLGVRARGSTRARDLATSGVHPSPREVLFHLRTYFCLGALIYAFITF